MTTAHFPGMPTVKLDLGAAESRDLIWRKVQFVCVSSEPSPQCWLKRTPDYIYPVTPWRCGHGTRCSGVLLVTSINPRTQTN